MREMPSLLAPSNADSDRKSTFAAILKPDAVAARLESVRIGITPVRDSPVPQSRRAALQHEVRMKKSYASLDPSDPMFACSAGCLRTQQRAVCSTA